MIARICWIISQSGANTIVFLVKLAFVNPQIVFPLSTLAPLIPAFVWIGVASLGFVGATGLRGVTPGRWICRIRVVRTTLRPCGVARALHRELLLWFDIPLLITAIPGVLCQLVTVNRQRIGDRLADTIVIEAFETTTSRGADLESNPAN